MPLFNYECKSCQHVVEKFVHSRDEVVEIVCPNCSNKEFTKVLSNARNRVLLNAKDNLHSKILPDAQRIQKEISKGKDSSFLDLYGEK